MISFYYIQAEKIHDNTGEDDPIEKQEEMDRMRAHVMSEFDKDENRMISYEEFSRGINGTDARNDLGWQVSFDSIMSNMNSMFCL